MMVRKLTLLVASGLLALVVAEVLLRFTYEPSTARIEGTLLTAASYHRPDPELQIVPRPHVRGEHVKRGSFASTFTTNSHGLRGREIAREKTPGMTRIAVIGDSFTWGYGVNDDSVFPALLEKRLPATEVINLGVSGYGLKEEIAYFRRVGLDFDPDILIVALVQNDIVVGQVRGTVPSAREDDATAVQPPSSFGSLKRRLAERSWLYMLAIDGLNGNRALVELAVKLGLKGELGGLSDLDFNLMPALRDPPERVRVGWDSTFVRLRRLASLSDSLGIRLVIALVPALQAVDREQLERSLVRSRYWTDDFEMDEPYRRVEQFAAGDSIEVINPLDTFRHAHDAGERLYLRRDMHFSERGHALFADAIARHVGR